MLHDETEIRERQAAVLRAMSAEQRAAVMQGLHEWARELKRAGFAHDHPEWDAARLESEVRALMMNVGR